MTKDIYVHVLQSAVEKDDDEENVMSTIRVAYVAHEESGSLLQRCGGEEATSRPQISPQVRESLKKGVYALSEDGSHNMVWPSTRTTGDIGSVSDIFAIPRPPVSVYLHSGEQLGTAFPALTERTVRCTYQIGVSTTASLLQQFLKDSEKGIQHLAIAFETEDGTPMPQDNTPLFLSLKKDTDCFVIAQQPKKVVKQGSKKDSKTEDSAIAEIRRLVEDARQRGSQRNAMAVCARGLEDAKKERSLPHIFALSTLLAELQNDAKKPLVATETLKDALEYAVTSTEKKQLLRRIGMLLFDAKEYRESCRIFAQYVEEAGSRSPQELANDVELNEVKIRLGGALYLAGEHDQGIGIVQTTLGGDLKNDLGVHWMARFYLGRGLEKDAMSWAIQLVARNHNHKEHSKLMQKLFVDVLRTLGSQRSIEVINEIIPTPQKPSPDLASAVGHLALVARDHSIMDVSIALYRKSLAMSHSPILALNYVHTLENDGQMHEALIELKKILNTFGALSVEDVSCRRVAELMGDFDKETNSTFPVPLAAAVERLKRPRQYVRVEETTEAVLLFDDREAAQRVPCAVLADPPKDEATKVRKSKYSDFQLELLALFFASVKALYMMGYLDRIPALLAYINPLRKDGNLQFTIVRNEAAYFATVAMLMQHLDPDRTAAYDETQMDALYVVGDSHSFSPSWHAIQLDSTTQKQTLTICAVVTGVKIWHLRDESDFYPKHLYHRVVAAIPKSSKVMVVMGEIDCREGIIQTVERGVYDTVQEAQGCICRIYRDVLRKLKRTRSLSLLLVHPPPPSVEPTRRIVLQLWKALEDSFLNASSRAEGIVYFKLPLVRDDASQELLPQYVLDRTHVNPSYVLDGVLEREIKSALLL